MNKTFLHSNSYDWTKHTKGEVNNEPSMTVPDQSLTIPQILDMYTRGIGIDALVKTPIGYDDPDFDDLDPTQEPAFDLVQAKQLLEETQERIKAEKNYATVKPRVGEPIATPMEMPHQITLDEAIETEKTKGTK